MFDSIYVLVFVMIQSLEYNIKWIPNLSYTNLGIVEYFQMYIMIKDKLLYECICLYSFYCDARLSMHWQINFYYNTKLDTCAHWFDCARSRLVRHTGPAPSEGMSGPRPQ